MLNSHAAATCASGFAQGPLAGVLALATLGTALFTYGAPLLDPASITTETLQSALPGTALLAAVLAVHEGGHQWVRCLAVGGMRRSM